MKMVIDEKGTPSWESVMDLYSVHGGLIGHQTVNVGSKLYSFGGWDVQLNQTLDNVRVFYSETREI